MQHPLNLTIDERVVERMKFEALRHKLTVSEITSSSGGGI
jgi:hypothetical protein